jgi:hypothetical protein
MGKLDFKFWSAAFLAITTLLTALFISDSITQPLFAVASIISSTHVLQQFSNPN